MKAILVLFLFLIHCCASSSCKEFVIDQSSGRCKPACIQDHGVPCCSIEHVARVCGTNVSNITLAIYGDINVTEAVIFENISYLSIIGNSVDREPPILSCSPLANSLPGFKFVNVVSLHISDVKIANCGPGLFYVNSTVITVGVTITDSSTVSLVNVSITQSIGTSLLIENIFGNVSLENVVVESNRFLNNFTDGGKSFAGGVLIMFDTSLTNLAVSDYRITNCEFKNITTPDYRSYDVRYINTATTKWVGYGLGGGLSIIIDEKSSHISVFVKNCTFWLNTAPWGAGIVSTSRC